MLEPRAVAEAVRDDVATVLEDVLPAGDDDGAGFRVPDPFTVVAETGIRNDDGSVAVVPWEWTGVNARGLFGLDPTFRRITVRGTTIVSEEGGTPMFRRYIDWLDVLAQAGVAVYTRPIVDVRQGFDLTSLEAIPELAEVFNANPRS